MPAIAELFDIRSRYLRAAHLVRDYTDPDALSGYVLTPSVVQAFNRLSVGLAPTSTQRAWRITGDFGSGKSSFALAFAHLFGSDSQVIPAELKAGLERESLRLPQVQLLPILVVASSEPLSVSILQALERALSSFSKRSKIQEKIRVELMRRHETGAEARAIALLEEGSKHVCALGKGSGLLIIIDELGKFLEYAALNPDRQDTYILQNLADAATRSGKNPLFVVGLLHQGFAAYADQLSHSAQIEWEKVGGRFDEIIFNHPLEQIAALVAAALNVSRDRLSPSWKSYAAEEMASAQAMGWYGSGGSRESLVGSAAGCFPLHPTVLPVMVRLFQRFGQNERSLFSFLIGNEPLALQDHALLEANGDPFYRLHHLYDYARGAFGHRLSVQSYRSHWNHIDSVVQSFPQEDGPGLRLLKTVGLLNMLDTAPLNPSEEALVLSVCQQGQDPEQVRRSLRDLQQSSRVLYFRGRSAGYCLWPHTSVNLERAYEEAVRAVGADDRVLGLVRQHLDSRPIVAKRHYIETGNLRYFAVDYVSSSELRTILQDPGGTADGRIVVVLCRTDEERRDARAAAQSGDLAERQHLLVAIPGPLRNLAGLVQEYLRWQWVNENTPELAGDPYAAEEVSRQLAASRRTLENRILDVVGVRHFSGTAEIAWFHCGCPLHVENGRALAEVLSSICDDVFAQATRIHNELVNRRALSSAATAARLRLIGRILEFPSLQLLGMDPTQRPPEMSMYFSVLGRTSLHRQRDGRWALAEPDTSDDPCNLQPALGAMRQLLEGSADARVSVRRVFQFLREAPYGVSEGMLPLLLAIFAAVHEHQVAFYENGSFLVKVEADTFMRLIKDPRAFEIQYCRIDGIRSAVYEHILTTLQLPHSTDGRFELLDVIRPLCTFAARLPQYTRQTGKLTATARAVRDTLLVTQEPPTLLFRDLPVACGLPPFSAGEGSDSNRIQGFVDALRGTLDELRAAYPKLLERIRDTLALTFEVSGSCQDLRDQLSERTLGAVAAISDLQLKAFCLRLTDTHLGESGWLESVASLISEKPPAKWTDRDEEAYHREAHQLGQRLRRVESLLFATADGVDPASAQRIVITRADGSEVDRVIHLPAGERSRAQELEANFVKVLRQAGPTGLTAAARAVWALLEDAPGATE